MYNFNLLGSHNYWLIERLASKASLQEKVDHKCEFIGATNSEGSLIGVAGTNFDLYPNIARFEHIIIHPDYQKTRLAVALMFRMERMIKEKGFERYFAFIPNDNFLMRNYAEKWGMELCEQKERGAWYIKTIKEKAHAMVC